MMKNNRTTNTIVNSSFASLSHVIILFFSFITRTCFIYYLGPEYLGFDSLFTNILSILSIVDLGLGTALNFFLYKPFRDDDKEKIAATIQYFRKIFCILGFILFLLSLIIAPFIDHFVVNIGSDLRYLQIVFILYAVMTFSSYFFVDSRTLFFASQKNYIVLSYVFVARIIIKILQIISLVKMPNYMMYLLIEITINLIVNIIISSKARKEFSYVYGERKTLKSSDKVEIFNDVKYLSIGKIAQVGISSTDSIIISKFVGTLALGTYSNYLLIIGSSMVIIENFTNGIIASLGDLFAENNQEKIERTFKFYNFITFQTSAFYLVAVISLIQPFMYLWLNGSLLLDCYIVGIAVFNNAFLIMWNSVRNIIPTKGLFKKDLPIQLLQVAINLFVSLLLVKSLGMFGVFVGTTVSYIFAYFLQAKLITDVVLKKTCYGFLKHQCIYGSIALIQLFIIYFVVDLIFFQYTILNLVIRGLLICILFFASEYIIYRKNIEFIRCKKIILAILRKG